MVVDDREEHFNFLFFLINNAVAARFFIHEGAIATIIIIPVRVCPLTNASWVICSDFGDEIITVKLHFLGN